ncbi:MAG: HAD family hydrolase [Thermoguttaceae bacterium]|nr:HAD hydrolase-like protein [Thermoguttaceae bacterium]MBQ5366231.1 HAD hydrolase-like protein [Thermoguttaceae bacterium]
MFKAVVFDFDGTIANTLPICFNAFRRVTEPIVGKMTDSEIRAKYFGPTEEGIFHTHFPEHAEEMLKEYYKYYEEMQKETNNTVPGLMELIHALSRKGVHVALVTAKGPVSCKISLEHYGIVDAFETIEVGSPKGRAKDVGILKALDAMGVKPDEAIYVGDSYKDVISSRKAHVVSWGAVWLPTAEPERVLAEKPDEIFYNVEDFKARLEEIFGSLD